MWALDVLSAFFVALWIGMALVSGVSLYVALVVGNNSSAYVKLLEYLDCKRGSAWSEAHKTRYRLLGAEARTEVEGIELFRMAQQGAEFGGERAVQMILADRIGDLVSRRLDGCEQAELRRLVPALRDALFRKRRTGPK